MTVGRAVSVGAEVALVVVVGALVAGQILGYPVLLGFVETGSMAPTLDPGDGFVAIPAAIDGDIEEGEVIVFRAQELNGGGLTTHRVVGRTDRGYITRGDANPFTDQDGNEPPVKEAQIVAKAWQVGGSVVVIPHLGTVVTGLQNGVSATQGWLASVLGTRAVLGTQGLTYLLLGASALLYLLDLRTAGRDRDRSRSRDHDRGLSTRVIVGALVLIVVASATAAMVVPAGTQQYGIVSAEFDSEDPTVIRQGAESSLPYPVPNAGVIPTVVYLEPASDGVETRPRRLHVPGRSTADATLVLSAPPETGYYRRYVTEYRYLAVLPTPVIDACYRLHPWVPIVVIDAVFGIPFYLFGVRVVGTGRIRSRSRGGTLGLRRLLNRYV